MQLNHKKNNTMKNIISILIFIFILSLQIIFAQNSNEIVQYEKYTPCTFSISLPVQFKLINEYPNERIPDFCEYFVKTKVGIEKFFIRSQITSRAGFENIKESYKEKLSEGKYNIVYKIQKDNWFVISGTIKENGNIIYLSVLYIEYSKSQKNEIEPFLSKISTSFTSQ